MTFILQSKQGTRSIIGTVLLLIYLFSNITRVHSSCRNGCDLALASFFVWRGSNLPIISKLFDNIPINDILDWNTDIANVFSVLAESRINIPFRCDCLNNGDYLGHVFKYNASANDTYDLITTKYYSNLTNKEWLMRINSYPEGNIPNNVTLNVTVNCSCGNKDVYKDHGLFITYLMRPGENLASIALATNTSSELIEKYNPMVNLQRGVVHSRQRIFSGDSYNGIASYDYMGLITGEWLMWFNVNRVGILMVIMNCSCGNKEVSEDYGLFITYPMRPGETLESIALKTNTSSELIQMYNPGVNFSAGTGLRYIPGIDKLGNYPPMPTRKGASGKAIAGTAVASLAGVTLLICIIYVGFYRKKEQKVAPHISASADKLHPSDPGLLGIAVDKSVEFSYKELAESTNGFSISNKIGEGGFGTVYYAELRGKIAAIKKMNRQAKTEFLAELKILTRVHHLNLVCLMGYCVDRYLFLVYEYIDNGNLSQHLRGWDTLPWSTRMQIALDSARGLEYIHEHTVPVCIHRDIKSANILIDKNFHAKVGDFGLTKLVENGNSTIPTRFMGTFGYMPPEYGHSGIVSPKVDVYAFGVVLYELISSKEAVIKEEGVDEERSLVALFEEAHNHPNTIEGISRLIDPKLKDNYPFDSVHKVAQLAKACTEKDHEMWPTMRSVVVALMALSSLT